ncbi:phosphoserine aminotransferase [Fusarium albosuccineum]|uniref:Phosphoserine aminotransferase n=1 Tax=Fusarium albosuccineum TaxID=1237068 RepID=A0A8H4NUN4_9HYPO|nr:phosphoserine aminotransferase [Fusarium albosuccineum]
MATTTQPKMTHEFDLTVIGPPGFASEASPHSDLSVAHVYEGSLKSSDGAIEIPLTAGSDWMRLHKSYADIDARVSCASLKGAEKQLQCDVEYKGKIAFHGPMLQLWKGEKDSLDWCEGYYYTTPLLSSRCQELAWVNEAVFVGMGKISVNDDGKVQVVYRIFKVG